MISAAENTNIVNESLHEEVEIGDTGAVSLEPEENPEGVKSEEDEGENESETAGVGVDYELLVREDTEALRREFPELRYLKDITDLDNPLRYAALRDLGLTPAEAYMATARRSARDNRSHLYSAKTVSSSQKGVMSEAELSAAREIFVGVSDADIRKLYKRVTK